MGDSDEREDLESIELRVSVLPKLAKALDDSTILHTQAYHLHK